MHRPVQNENKLKAFNKELAFERHWTVLSVFNKNK